MREIKFRAWDDFNEEMIDYLKIDEQGWIFSSKTNSPFVMQFTGILDRNGKEIYEGDVITTFWQDHVGRDWEMTGVVVWDSEVACFLTVNDAKEQSMPLHSLERDEFFPEHTKVIGNIYENGELLEVKP